MFAYDKNLSNGKLCELFIEDGNLFTDGKNIMYKRGNIYRTLPQDRVQSLLRTNMTPETRMNMSPYQLNTIIELIKQNPDIYINTDVFNTGCICFSNGIYDVSERRLKAFDDEYYWSVVDAEYKENVTLEDAPVFLNFLETSLDYPQKPEKADLLLETIGYDLSDYMTAKKGFFFIGEPSSGKSKILEFLQVLVGNEEVSQIALSQISSRFSLGQLQGKRLNICTELPSNKFPAIETFKALTSGDRVYGEMKGKDGFDYYPKVKLLNAGNTVPVPKEADGTSSIIDRMVFLMFNHSIPKEQWNVNLVWDLIDERDVICSLAVKALERLVDNNFEFTLPDDSKVFMEGYKHMLNVFPVFIDEACILQEDLYVESKRLWDCYVEFCRDNNFPEGITRPTFAQKLTMIEGIRKKRIRENGKQITIFKGIAINNGISNIKKI